MFFFFFSSRRRHTRCLSDWSSDVCSSDLNFVKLAYMATSLHHSGGTICEPVDLPVNKRHFDMVYSHMKYSDKPYMGSVTHPRSEERRVGKECRSRCASRH